MSLPLISSRMDAPMFEAYKGTGNSAIDTTRPGDKEGLVASDIVETLYVQRCIPNPKTT